MVRETRISSVPATIKVRSFFAVEEVLRSLGADPGKVLQAAGLDPHLFSNLERMVLYSDADRLFTYAISATGCEDFGLRVGMRADATVIGLAGLMSMNCRTVGEAWRTVVEGLRASGSGRAINLDIRSRTASLSYVIMAAGIENVDHITDTAIATMVNAMRQFCDSTWRPDQIFLPRKPPRDLKPFASFFGAPIIFAAPAGKLVFDASTLGRPVSNQNPKSREILRPLLDAALAETESDFVSVVKAVIRGQIGAGRLTRERVARAMALSVNALAVRLRTSGTSFGDLLDEAEFDLAQTLLMKGKTVEGIAADLAFADKSAFTRAFKKWAGMPPGRWRAQRASSPRRSKAGSPQGLSAAAHEQED
jgi:AraC-like DNA-binding protein